MFGPYPYPYLMDLPPPEEPRFWLAPGGKKIAWAEYGDPGSVKVVMYYHGWPSCRLQGALVHHLARERGLRVISLDRPGIGFSDHMPGRRLLDWPKTMAAFADANGIGKFAQLGVSGGGPYVLACAAALSGRVVGSAVLCGAVPIKPGAIKGFHPLYRAFIPIRKLPSPVFAPVFAVLRFFTRGDVVHQPLAAVSRTLPAADLEVLDGNPQTAPVFVRNFREGVRQGARGAMGDADIYFQDWGIDLAEMPHEIRYWHGAADANIPVGRVLDFVPRIKGAILEVDDRLGHFSVALLRAPAAMDYLNEKIRNQNGYPMDDKLEVSRKAEHVGSIE